MATAFYLKANKEQLADVISAMSEIKNGYETVMKNAINRTISTVKTQAVARIANKMNLSSTSIKEDFWTVRATSSKLKGGVLAKGKPMGLIWFLGWKQTSAGIKIKIYKDSGAKVIAHAFTAYTKQSKMQIRQRSYKGVRKPFKPRLSYGSLPWKFEGGKKITPGRAANYRGPMLILRGPRVEDVFIKPEIYDPVTIQAQTLFVQRIDQEVTELFRKLAAIGKI